MAFMLSKKTQLTLMFVGVSFWIFAPLFFIDLRPYHQDNSIITDKNYQIIYTFPKEIYTYQKNIPLTEAPELFQKLLIYKEDRNFYQNHGVEVFTKIKILGNFILHGHLQRGGSTITEQWIKNKYFPKKSRNILQKIREFFLAISLTKTTSKNQILEEYINHIYFGNQAYGIAQASEFYFKKIPKDLTPNEQIFLLSLISNPSRFYDQDFDFTHLRKHWLKVAQEKNWLTDLEYREFSGKKLQIKFPQIQKSHNFFFLQSVKDQISQNLKPEKGGIIISSTLDAQKQKKIYQEIQPILAEIKTQGAYDHSIIVMDAKTGNVIVNLSQSQTLKNQNPTTTLRPIASTIKPFLFTYFFSKNPQINPQQKILDKETSIPLPNGEIYRVKNFNGKEYGEVSISEVLANSLNIGAVQILEKVGTQNFYNFLQKIGFELQNSPDFYGLSLALGTNRLSPLKLTEKYTLFYHQGRNIAQARFIEKIHVNNHLYFSHKKTLTSPLDKGNLGDFQKALKTTYQILKDEDLRQKSFGFRSILNDGKNFAYKTGTSPNFYDNWAIAMNDQYIITIWVGNLNKQKMEVLSGISGSGPILKKVLEIID